MYTSIVKTALPVLVAVAAICVPPVRADSDARVSQEVLTLERQAMDGWLKGNPDPQLAICDSEITYFHAVVEKRLEGFAAVKELYEQYRGRPLFSSYEILNPKVQAVGDVAVLTYRLAQRNASVTTYWNATQVYRKRPAGWRIIHSHFSAEKAQP